MAVAPSPLACTDDRRQLGLLVLPPYHPAQVLKRPSNADVWQWVMVGLLAQDVQLRATSNHVRPTKSLREEVGCYHERNEWKNHHNDDVLISMRPHASTSPTEQEREAFPCGSGTTHTIVGIAVNNGGAVIARSWPPPPRFIRRRHSMHIRA